MESGYGPPRLVARKSSNLKRAGPLLVDELM
jgi:hypothetical protein